MHRKIKAQIVDIKADHIMEMIDGVLQDNGYDINPIREAISQAIRIGVSETEAD